MSPPFAGRGCNQRTKADYLFPGPIDGFVQAGTDYMYKVNNLSNTGTIATNSGLIIPMQGLNPDFAVE